MGFYFLIIRLIIFSDIINTFYATCYDAYICEEGDARIVSKRERSRQIQDIEEEETQIASQSKRISTIIVAYDKK